MTKKKTVEEKLEEVESWHRVWECRDCDYADVLGIVEEDVNEEEVKRQNEEEVKRHDEEEEKVDTVVCPNCGSANFETWKCNQWSEKENTGHI